MPKSLPDPETLRKLLRYDPDTGKLFWLERDNNSWNQRYAGREALTTSDRDGYKRGSVLCVDCRAHRVIWAMETGEWPADMIDHIDGDVTNNRMENLRQANNSQNSSNRKSATGSKSKYLGVCWHSALNKWQVSIRANGSSIYIGVFKCETYAALAYDKAAHKYHGEFARLNFLQSKPHPPTTSPP